jgi:hypothetical protein
MQECVVLLPLLATWLLIQQDNNIIIIIIIIIILNVVLSAVECAYLIRPTRLFGSLLSVHIHVTL